MDTPGSKRCIACAEEIQQAALLCKHCHTDQRDPAYAAYPEFDNQVQQLSENEVDKTDAILESQPNDSRAQPNTQVGIDEPFFEPAPAKPANRALIATVSTLFIALTVLVIPSLLSSGGNVDRWAGVDWAQEAEMQDSQESVAFGVEIGQALRASNRLLFPDTQALCADAFSTYSLNRTLNFDDFMRGCRSVWRSSNTNTNQTNPTTQEGQDSAEVKDKLDQKAPVSQKVWAPTVENIKLCSLDDNAEGCPHLDSNYVVDKYKNTFGVSAEELVQRMISAGLCREWPDKVWDRIDRYYFCLTNAGSALEVATGDIQIWNLVLKSSDNESIAGGDGWMVWDPYTALEDMEKVANLLGGAAWSTGIEE